MGVVRGAKVLRSDRLCHVFMFSLLGSSCVPSQGEEMIIDWSQSKKKPSERAVQVGILSICIDVYNPGAGATEINHTVFTDHIYQLLYGN